MSLEEIVELEQLLPVTSVYRAYVLSENQELYYELLRIETKMYLKTIVSDVQ